jgi:hypothetical protein
MANFSLLAKIGIDSKALQTGLAKAEGRVGKFKAVIASLGPAIAAVGFTSMANKAINAGSAISDLSEQLRINARSLQVLMAVADKAGVAQSSLEKALMSVTIRTQEAMDGNKMYTESFERLGINLKEFSKLPTEEKLAVIANAYKSAGKSQEAFSDIASILGTRAGPKMLEVLRRLSDEGLASLTREAEKAGQVMSQDVIDKMDKAADTIGVFNRAMTVATATVLGKVIPAFVIFKESFGHIGDAMATLSIKLSSFFKFLGSSLMSVLDPAIKSFEAFGLSMLAAAQAATGDFAGAADSIKAAKDAAKSAGQELKNIPSEISEAYADANHEMEAVNQIMEKDTKERNEKIKESFADLFGYAKEESKKTGDAIAENLTGGDAGEDSDEESRSAKMLDMAEKIKEMKLESIRAEAEGDTAAQKAADHRLKVAEKALNLMKEYNLSQEEAVALAEKLANETDPEEAKKKNLEDLEKKINEMRLKAIRAQANGDEKAQKAMERRAEMAQRILDLMNQYNISQEEATIIANKTSKPEDITGEDDSKSSLTGHDLRKAANIAGKEEGIRFEKLADGGFQQFVKGKKGKVFSEADMQAGLQKQIDKDGTEGLLEKINKTLEGKFVSQ